MTPPFDVAQEGIRASETDAVTFSFADPAAELYGLARLGLAGTGSQRRGSALAVLFAGREPVTAIAEGDLAVPVDAAWERLVLPGLAATVDVPLERWSLRMAGERSSLALVFEAASPPASHLEGYEQLCRVSGEVTVDGVTTRIDGPGQRGHAWGAPNWRRLTSVHTVCGWLESGAGFALATARADGSKGHEDDERWAVLLAPGTTTPVIDPRLSTTYDGGGRQRRAGLELWVGEDDDFPHRAAGSVVCGSTLELGQLRLDCAFMRWTMDGGRGIGRYDVLRRAE